MILYLGDGSIFGPAMYLTGVMQHHQMSWQRVNSDASPTDEQINSCRVAVLSDYPRARFRDGQLEKLAERVERVECGLLMIGGWESYHGLLGEYHNTILKEVLPVTMLARDDRVNCPQPVFIVPKNESLLQHPILANLPWQTPSAVGGYNKITAKKEATTLLDALRVQVIYENDSLKLTPQERDAMLVVGNYGKGRVAALATDAAPHWVGQWVDWGKSRVTQKLVDERGVDAGFIEVGDAYMQFFSQLLRWVGEN